MTALAPSEVFISGHFKTLNLSKPDFFTLSGRPLFLLCWQRRWHVAALHRRDIHVIRHVKLHFPDRKKLILLLMSDFKGILLKTAGLIRHGLHSQTLRYMVTSLEAHGLTDKVFVQGCGAPLTTMKLAKTRNFRCQEDFEAGLMFGIRARWKGQHCQNVGAEASRLQVVLSSNVSWPHAVSSFSSNELSGYILVQITWT